MVNPSWEGFRNAVIRRFEPSMMENPHELLLGLNKHQQWKMMEYAQLIHKKKLAFWAEGNSPWEQN